MWSPNEAVIIICQYPDGDYAGMDLGSGGYPYHTTSIRTAYAWENVEKAKRYAEMFKSDGLKVVRATVSVRIEPC